jgi:hypothetical protein
MADKTLEATVLVQGCLLRALAWKQAVPSEPILRHFHNHYAQLVKSLNSQNPVDSELVAELGNASKTLTRQLPSGI